MLTLAVYLNTQVVLFTSSMQVLLALYKEYYQGAKATIADITGKILWASPT